MADKLSICGRKQRFAVSRGGIACRGNGRGTGVPMQLRASVDRNELTTRAKLTQSVVGLESQRME